MKYFRIVEVSGKEWQEFDEGEGDGVAEFAEYCEDLRSDTSRTVTKDTKDEIEAHLDYKGYKLRWCVRLIHEDVWPFVVYYDDRKLDINVELFKFRAIDQADAERQLRSHLGVETLPATFLVEKCYRWEYNPEVVELEG